MSSCKSTVYPCTRQAVVLENVCKKNDVLHLVNCKVDELNGIFLFVTVVEDTRNVDDRTAYS